MYHCLVIYLVSSTDQIYHLAASRLSDKLDRSMTLGKLLDNNAQLFIFISEIKHKEQLHVYGEMFSDFLNNTLPPTLKLSLTTMVDLTGC